MYWHYTPRIAGGGEKWRLIDADGGSPVTLATVIRLPGSLTRIYRLHGTSSDHASPAAAWKVLADYYGESEVPRITNANDADIARVL